MLPEFEGLDRWIPRAYRENLIDAINMGAIHVERLTLEDLDLGHPLALEHLADRWKPTSPLYRAGRAVFAYLLERGVGPAQVHLHGRDVQDPETPYFAGFSLRYLRAMQRCFTEHGGREWIEVVHPTIRGKLVTLKLLPADMVRLEGLAWLRGS